CRQRGPAVAPGTCHPYVPGAVSGPEDARGKRRLGDRVDDAERLGAAAARVDLLDVVRRQLRAHRLPVGAVLGEKEDAVPAEEERALLMRARDEGRVPVEAEDGLALSRLGAQALALAVREGQAHD